ncbi:MAG TPA: gluconate 2-dehydrogenase subunit 3 family protein [Candidatus Limnocylindria bacterium]|jgi:hypothetical protein|nr:gluconate 2-dehydrogenase subunit 3 family protein [Candidatus Limnocylindria bacterium]
MNQSLESSGERRISRREALQWVLAAGVATTLPLPTFAADGAADPSGKPYGMDPVLNKTYKPGDFWPLTLSAGQRRTSDALSDIIIPEDAKSPAASSVGVTDFIDEWISAPYPGQKEDRGHVLDLLSYVDKESQSRFQKGFADVTVEQQTTIVDELAYIPRATEKNKGQAGQFNLFRNLVMGGFYSTPKGMADVGFMGNKPMLRWDGPPKEVLVKLGLA